MPTYLLGMRKYWDVPITIYNRSYQSQPIRTCLQARDNGYFLELRITDFTEKSEIFKSKYWVLKDLLNNVFATLTSPHFCIANGSCAKWPWLLTWTKVLHFALCLFAVLFNNGCYLPLKITQVTTIVLSHWFNLSKKWLSGEIGSVSLIKALTCFKWCVKHVSIYTVHISYSRIALLQNFYVSYYYYCM